MAGRLWCRPCALAWQRNPSSREPLSETEDTGKGYISDCCPDWRDEIPPRYHRASLEDLADPLVETFHALPDDKGLYLWGRPGVGKTHAQAAFAKSLWSQGWEFRRFSYEDILLSIRDGFNSGVSELKALQSLCHVPKLFVEDVGVTVSLGQQETDFSLRTFVTLLDTRLEYCLATFITSNKSLEELAKSFDERVASRLCGACEIVQVTGEDKRR